MDIQLLNTFLREEADVLLIRQRARQIGRLISLAEHDRTRLATAASEVARNAVRYAGEGEVVFGIGRRNGRTMLIVRVTDDGPGITDVDAILSGQYDSTTGMGAGLAGAQRLMDHFELESDPGQGTTVTLGMEVPESIEASASTLAHRVGEEMARVSPTDPFVEMRHQNEELIAALEAAEHAIEMRETILAVVSHDLRNPLSVIGMSSAIAQRTDAVKENERLRTLFERIDNSVAQMTRLISDLQDMASIQAGQMAVDIRRQPIGPIVDRTLALHQPIAEKQGVATESDIDRDLVLECDDDRIQQALSNLLGNAIKFSPEGASVHVAAERSPTEPSMCRFTIRDQGPGIPPEHVPRLFEPYWTTAGRDDENSKKNDGTGLGLFITKGIVAAHGGRIWVESTPDEGSTFAFTVPLAGGSTAREESD